MKQLKILMLFCVIGIIAVACDSKMEPEDGTVEEGMLFDKGGYHYSISVSFCDKAGNDLVAPLAEERYISNPRYNEWEGEINPAKYSLEISLSNPIAEFKRYHSAGSLNDNFGPLFFIGKYTGEINYLTNSFNHFRYQYADDNYNEIVENPRQEFVKYTITCNTIFNDKEAHELVVYWDNVSTKGKWVEMKCIKALFDGKDCEVYNQEYDGMLDNNIRVTLDN